LGSDHVEKASGDLSVKVNDGFGVVIDGCAS